MRLVWEHSLCNTSRMGSPRSKYPHWNGTCNVQQQYSDEKVIWGDLIFFLLFIFIYRMFCSLEPVWSNRRKVRVKGRAVFVKRHFHHTPACTFIKRHTMVINRRFMAHLSLLIWIFFVLLAEKSFVCPQSNCSKGFNVKSNLLRHVRSCHNQLSPNENQDSDSVD